MNYKLVLFVAWLMFLTLGTTSCGTTRRLTREEMAANLEHIHKIEFHQDVIKAQTQFLKSVDAVSEEVLSELRAHNDIFYAHYLAANISLANGDLESYLLNLENAEKELNAMDKIIEKTAKENTKKILKSLGPL